MNSLLKNDLMNIIVNEFGNNLTRSEFNQYVTKLRDYFIPYIVEEKRYAEKVCDLFEYDLTKSDIINGTIYYIANNQNVTSKSAIDDYLIALNMLFEKTINKKYFNQNLVNNQPFVKLNKEVEEKVIRNKIKVLKNKEADPSISDVEYKYIIQYLNDYQAKNLKSHEVRIILKLLLLYGFSFDKIMNLEKKDYSPEKGTLSIVYDKSNLLHITLELPYMLNRLLKECCEIRDKKYKNVQFLFVNEAGNKIDHGFVIDILKKIRGKFIMENKSCNDEKNRFTATGLAKYAVIQMILEGMNQSMILNLTGFREDQFSYCQDYVNELKNLNRNRYVNHVIRGIPTYDDI